jgi:hypothetical protein
VVLLLPTLLRPQMRPVEQTGSSQQQQLSQSKLSRQMQQQQQQQRVPSLGCHQSTSTMTSLGSL